MTTTPENIHNMLNEEGHGRLEGMKDPELEGEMKDFMNPIQTDSGKIQDMAWDQDEMIIAEWVKEKLTMNGWTKLL